MQADLGKHLTPQEDDAEAGVQLQCLNFMRGRSGKSTRLEVDEHGFRPVACTWVVTVDFGK